MNVFAILASLAAVLPGLNELPPRPIPSVEYQSNNLSIVVFAGGPNETDSLCRSALKGAYPDMQLVGCMWKLKNGANVMVVENPCLYPNDLYARHVCHELGHVNNWPADHPNAQ